MDSSFLAAMRPQVVTSTPEFAGRTTTEEGSGCMSQSTSPEAGPVVKTLAIRLELQLHAQLSVLAQLQGHTITDEIRLAIENHIEQTRSNPALTAKADAVRQDIERDAEARREAIASLFGDPPAAEAAEPAKPTRKGPRSGSTEG